MSTSYNYRLKRITTVYNKKCEFATNNRSKITIKVCFDKLAFYENNCQMEEKLNRRK